MTSSASRVASRYFEAQYQRLFFAMSLDQAKETLGFPSSYDPTPEEIRKAWRELAFKNHPDRGGDLDRMVEVNVAKDVLEGKGRDSWTPDRSPPPPRPRPAPPPPVEPDVIMEGNTFEKAWAENTPPTTTEWKFVSSYEFFQQDYTIIHRVWSLYGVTDSKHIFCAIKYRPEVQGIFMRDGKRTKALERWDVSFIEAPIKQDLNKIAQKSLKSVSTSWSDGASPKPPKKFSLWKWGRPTDEILKKIQYNAGISLKDILVSIGAAAEGTRKTIVAMSFLENKAKRLKLRSEGKPVYQGDAIDVILHINGKEVMLEDGTILKMKRMVFPYVIGWDNIVPGHRPINITSKRGGSWGKANAADSLKLILDSLTTEPSWVATALEKAVGEYSSETKKAAFFDVRSEMTLRQAAMVLNTSMYDVFNTIHG